MKISSTLLFILFIQLSYARTLEVCSTCPNQSIASALEEAEPGDEIRILSGIYREHDLQLTKSVKIIGSGKAIIDGEGKGTVFHCKAKNFTIENLTIRNVGQSYTKDHAAILLNHCDSFKLSNNILENVFFGCLIEKSHTGVISGNRISSNAKLEAGSGNGIHLWHSSGVEIKNNYLTGLRDGIYFEFVSHCIIKNNHSTRNLRYGLHFMFSNENEYTSNIFEYNGAGVAVMFSKMILMKNNIFRHNWGAAAYGLLLKEIYDSRIESNHFIKNTVGVNIDGSTRIEFINNTFERNGWAVKVLGACYKNDFSRNNFLSNSFDLAYNSKINENNFNNNYWSDYTGYDLDKDGTGDIPYRPVKLFSYIVNKTPEAIILLRSLFVYIINFSEKVSPVFTPDNLSDEKPSMKRFK